VRNVLGSTGRAASGFESISGLPDVIDYPLRPGV